VKLWTVVRQDPQRVSLDRGDGELTQLLGQKAVRLSSHGLVPHLVRRDRHLAQLQAKLPLGVHDLPAVAVLVHERALFFDCTAWAVRITCAAPAW
jgi:hypothetical protein